MKLVRKCIVNETTPVLNVPPMNLIIKHKIEGTASEIKLIKNVTVINQITSCLGALMNVQ